MLNRVTLIGHVGQDPEVKDVEGEHQVVNFSLATSYSYRDAQGERQEATEWHRIAAWDRDAASLAQIVRKGDLVFIEGRLDYGVWKDRKSGQDRREAQIRLTGWRKIHSPASRQASGAGAGGPAEPEGEPGVPAGDEP